MNNVAPGPMDTRKPSHWYSGGVPCSFKRSNMRLSTAFFYPQESPEAVEFHKANAMGNRLTMVEDIAPIIRFLCTDGAWITGQTIFANGGYTTR